MRSLFVPVIAAGLFAACGTRTAKEVPLVAKPTIPSAFPALKNDSPFSPAFTRLDASALGSGSVDTGSLGDAIQCVGCHADVAAQWDPSAHHNSSFSNRFYAVSVDLTRKHRGNKVSRWCAGCHDPSLLLANATASTVDPIIDHDDVEKSPRAGDGIGCLVCHSTTEGARTGGGGYLIKWRPFKEPDPKNAQSVADHKAAMRAPVMEKAEFCGSCHKVSLHEDVNGKRWLRGQNDFDPWEQGPYAFGGQKTAGQIYAPETPEKRCQDCHMPREAAKHNDLAAKSGTVKSHRFLAANTALAAFAGDHETVKLEQSALADAVRVDVIAIRRAEAIHTAVEPSALELKAGDRIALDVVVENTNVGHKFPTGTVDSNEVWLALEVLDKNGNVVAKSGALDANDALGSEAHRFGVLQLDNTGTPAVLRDAHRFTAAGWDTTIGPRDARVVRYALTVPATAALPLRARARVLYRKFPAAYALAACKSPAASAPAMAACPKLPISEVAHDEVFLGAPNENKLERWRRLDAYARGLLNAVQEDVGDAQPILDEVMKLAPDRAHGPIDLARLRVRQGRTADADAALDLAAKLDPNTPVIPFLRGVARYEVYRLADAIEPLKLAIARTPHAVHATELLGEALQLAGDDLGSLTVLHGGLLIDPESAQLRHLEALAFDKLGVPAAAEIARAGYLRYRRDDDTPKLRAICRAKVPGCAREANPLHMHDLE
jgi:tetratricopeptide (TPR) repeat protein